VGARRPEWVRVTRVRSDRLPPDAVSEPESIGRVDFLYRSRGLIVEVDGRLGHSQVLDIEKDHRRDQESLVAGLRVVRITHRQLTRRPDEVVRVLQRLLVD
jgi:very-short-patch-repair endonuclease